MSSNRTSGNRHKLKHGRLSLNTGKHLGTSRVAKNGQKVARKVVESASSQMFRCHIDTVLSNSVEMSLLEQRQCIRYTPDVPPSYHYPVIMLLELVICHSFSVQNIASGKKVNNVNWEFINGHVNKYWYRGHIYRINCLICYTHIYRLKRVLIIQ